MVPAPGGSHAPRGEAGELVTAAQTVTTLAQPYGRVAQLLEEAIRPSHMGWESGVLLCASRITKLPHLSP